MSAKVSLLCPTAGRCFLQQKFLDEVVYWFLRQNHANSELVILNDVPHQTVVCDAPGVRVVNEDERYSSLGAKMNRLVELAEGEICLVAEDDDISLPWRAGQAVRMLEGFDYYNPHRFWYQEDGGPLKFDGQGVGHNCSAFRRNAFLGRYSDVTQNHDGIVDGWAEKNLRVNRTYADDPAEASFVYRWHTTIRHLSGFSPHMNTAYANHRTGPPGTFRIEPVMHQDFMKLRDDALKVMEVCDAAKG